MVASVAPRGAAERAGLRQGDRILAINGAPLRDVIDFHFHAGEERLRLGVDRDGRSHTLHLTRRPTGLGLELEAPRPAEIATCNRFLANEIAAMPSLRAVLALGAIAHGAVLRAAGRRVSSAKFAHGAMHALDGVVLADSYHCSRYNTNTGRLTEAMFHAVFDRLSEFLARHQN